MKKIIIIILSVLLVGGIGMFFMKKNTKKHSPAATAVYENEGFKMIVKYCSPSKKGRLVFGEESAEALQPYGQYWRVGANEATSFEVNSNITFGGKTLNAGKYQLYAYPGKDEWAICIGKDWDRWGYSEADKDDELIRINVAANNSAEVKESLLISFSEDASMNIAWDNVELKVPIQKQ